MSKFKVGQIIGHATEKAIRFAIVDISDREYSMKMLDGVEKGNVFISSVAYIDSFHYVVVGNVFSSGQLWLNLNKGIK